MRAIEVTAAGGPEELVLVETAPHALSHDHVRVRTAYAGVNFIDIYRRTGQYPVDFPNIPGSEGSGIVEEIGADVTNARVGDRVAWVDGTSSYAQNVTIRADRLIRVPSGIDLDVAAAVALQGLTAHFLTQSVVTITQDTAVLIHAGAGGVGLLATQMAAARGARVLTTVSTAAKADRSRDAGASEVIRYDEFDDISTDLPRVVRSLTDGQYVNVVFDGVGRTTFDGSLASLAKRGTLVVYGAASGPVPPVDIQRLNSGGSLFLTRPSLWHYITDTKELSERADDVFEWIRRGELNVHIGRTFALADAADAHRHLESRQSEGKVLLEVDGTLR